MSPLGDNVKKYGLCYHFYADDSQLYISILPKSVVDEKVAFSRIESCVEEIRSWMDLNKLKLNDGKTEFLLLGRKAQLNKVSCGVMTVRSATISTSGLVRNLGVLFGSELNIKKQVFSICQSAHYHLRNLQHIKDCIPCESLEINVHAFITSRLDYCNSLLTGIPKYLVNKLQLVQNAAARLITGVCKLEHITPVLYQLHWLPVEYRINFKILVMTYKILHGYAPKYLCDLIEVRQSSRTLRSSNKILLHIPRTKLSSAGDRALACAAPRLWNQLPTNNMQSNSLNSFKTNLKTHLFSTYFNHKM